VVKHQESNSPNPRPTGQRICYQTGRSAFALKTLCSGDDCVASGLFPHHTGCDEYIGTFHAVDGDCCTFNAGSAEYSGKCVTNCIEYEEEFINSTENDYHCINRSACSATNSTADDSGHGRASCIESVDGSEGGSGPIGGAATYHVPQRLEIARSAKQVCGTAQL
jgi:hypothetical protein